MVPVLLLTGFLGSGKTTLLNRLLASRPQSGAFSEEAGKLALIVNEFGDVGIDGDLLPDDMTRQIEIQGGCICCRLDGDLTKTLQELIDGPLPLSAILIETTGIAEPLPISWTLAQESLADKLRLAAVITVVDSLEHARHRPMAPSVDAQVEYADLLVMSKLDLATEDERAATEALVRETNQVAPIIAGNTEGLVARLWAALDDPTLEHVRGEGHGHAHEHAFDSVVVPIEEMLDFEQLTEELESLGANYLRIKGIARVVDPESGSSEPRLVAFHRVGARVSAEPVREGLQTRMVAIGTHINVDALRECIAASVLRS